MSELYQLPNGWEWRNITDITDLITCGVAKKPDYVKDGYPFLSAKNVKEFRISLDDYQYVNEKDFIALTKHNKPLNGDILYSRVGSFGEAALIDFDLDFAVYVSLTLIKVTKDKLNNKFMVYLLNSPYVRNLAKNSTTGIGVQNLNVGAVREFMLPLPPIEEQKRIVSKLDLLFEKIDKSIALHQKNMDEADVFMGSVLNDVFGELEEKYDKDLLSNYCQITSSKRVYKADYVDDGVLFYRIKDIVLMSKNLPITDSQYIKREAFDEFDKKFGSPKSGDILLTAVGATLGYTYLVTDKDGEFYFKDGNLLWMKTIKDLDRKYLLHIFKSPLFDRYLDEISKGAAQPAITIIKLKEFNIPIPPLHIQQKVVKYLDEVSEKIEKVKSVEKEKMDSLKVLKASILDRVFRGEL